MDKVYTIAALLLLLYVAGKAQTQGDLIINEVLFNPAKDGYDYVECYNRSNSMLHLNLMAIGNRNGAGDIASVKPISKDSTSLRPGAYLVITANEKWLRMNYQLDENTMVIQLASLPSYPDDEGNVVLLRKADSVIIDELYYNANWHFRMINNVAGVALERLSFDAPTNDKNNWTSAASSENYGTPGRLNSQYAASLLGDQMISLHPKLISPNNDGIDDLALLEINVAETGWVANTMIYDAAGRQVRFLVKNAVLGMHNRFAWDGYNDMRQRAPNGIYIVATQMFDMKGNTRKFKNCVALDNRWR